MIVTHAEKSGRKMRNKEYWVVIPAMTRDVAFMIFDGICKDLPFDGKIIERQSGEYDGLKEEKRKEEDGKR